MTRHVHADHIIAAAEDTTIEWEMLSFDESRWLPMEGSPLWSTDREYRQKPKPRRTIDLYQWAYKEQGDDHFTATTCFYESETAAIDGVLPESGYKLYRIEGSKITVEVNDE